jgi:hypothetical protein
VVTGGSGFASADVDVRGAAEAVESAGTDVGGVAVVWRSSAVGAPGMYTSDPSMSGAVGAGVAALADAAAKSLETSIGSRAFRSMTAPTHVTAARATTMPGRAGGAGGFIGRGGQ